MFYKRSSHEHSLTFYWLAGGLPLLLAIALSVTLCFFVSEESYAWIVTVDGVAGVVSLFVFLTVLYTKIIPFCEEKAFLSHLEKGTKEQFDGVIVGISTKAIHRRGLPFAEITIKSNGNERIYYYPLFSQPFPFSENDEVEFLSVGTYLYDVRKAKHEPNE